MYNDQPPMNKGSKSNNAHSKGLLHVLHHLTNMYVFVCLRWCIFVIFCNYMITGAVAFGETEGFWIISSVPRFPANVSTGYNYGESQTKKGQIILCVTVPGNIEDKISKFQCTS